MVVYTGGELRNKRITKVIVKDGVRQIDNFAFKGCPKLGSIAIPNSVTSIGHGAFHGLGELETISIPNSVKKIGFAAFYGCTSLKAIVIPEGVTEIDHVTFYNCQSLERITFPKSLTNIGKSAFYRCEALEQVDIPNGIKVIPTDSFLRCTALRTVILPPTIEEIQGDAFCECDNLNNFVIPNGLPALKYGFQPTGFTSNGIKQILANASNLKTISVRSRCDCDWIDDDIIPKVFEWVLACPTVREVDLSENGLSVGVFKKLVSQDIPVQLCLFEIKYQWGKRLEWAEVSWSPKYLLQLLEQNPKLVIKTDKFWDDDEDNRVRHHLDMNEYGCRSFTLRDSRWPELIEALYTLEEEGELRTGSSNILYQLLHRHLHLILLHQHRRNS